MLVKQKMGAQRGKVTPLNTHNETNSICQRAENPCPTSIFTKRIRSIVSIPMVSKLSTLFGPSGATRTRGFHIPNVAPYQLGYTRIFCYQDYSTKLVRFQVFPVCGQFCGQSGFSARFRCRGKSRKCPCFKGFQVLTVPVVDRKAYAPKPSAIPNFAKPGYFFSFGEGAVCGSSGAGRGSRAYPAAGRTEPYYNGFPGRMQDRFAHRAPLQPQDVPRAAGGSGRPKSGRRRALFPIPTKVYEFLLTYGEFYDMFS